NTVAWLDEDTLAFATDQHVGVVAAACGEVRRLASGGVAELQIVGGKILAGTKKLGIALIDPATLAVERSIACTGVA
ncbi:hypothetical protein ACSTHF_23115, partial [Vibrio parahaemolyticus]